MTLVIHPFGSVYAVGMRGAADAIKHQYYSFLNLQATKGDLYFLSEDFGYIYVEEEKFYKWLERSSIRVFENEIDDDYQPDNVEHKSRLDTILKKRQSKLFFHNFLSFSPQNSYKEFQVAGLNLNDY